MVRVKADTIIIKEFVSAKRDEIGANMAKLSRRILDGGYTSEIYDEAMDDRIYADELVVAALPIVHKMVHETIDSQF
jgi:hypothetical protein